MEKADEFSDWDFHVITSEPGLFSDSAWTGQLAGTKVLAYAVRSAAIGGVPKVNAVFSRGEADFVIIPETVLKALAQPIAAGHHLRDGPTRKALQDLAIVVRPGWRFLKDSCDWDDFYRRAVSDVPDPRLADGAALQLAEGFVCDYVWTLRKLARGELRAAQRMIHRELADANFRLLHELRLRRGEPSYPESRRIERIAPRSELVAVTVSASLKANALRTALEKCAASCQELMSALVGSAWHWPL